MTLFIRYKGKIAGTLHLSGKKREKIQAVTFKLYYNVYFRMQAVLLILAVYFIIHINVAPDIPQ